jgi:formate hydrogenlyase subunit 3/multisubunit Na+/H+ antiporter MnhD subunit
MSQPAVVTLSETEAFKDRIDSMFRMDRLAAGALVVALWLTVLFVIFAVRSFIEDKSIEVICWIGAGVLLLFNTGSIVAMFQHYAEDKEHIYAVDIRHLDAGR